MKIGQGTVLEIGYLRKIPLYDDICHSYMHEQGHSTETSTVTSTETSGKTIAVIIPCLNEEKTIGKVVSDFKRELPRAVIHVFDNGSTDNSVALAKSGGAIVTFEPHKGKGNVIRRMFEEIDADIYVMVDGDDTYFAEEVHDLLTPVLQGEADMVIGDRLAKADSEALNWLHHLGNRFLLTMLNSLFGSNFKDILSGFRVMNNDFVKNIPLLAQEFEVETEMTIQALERRYIVKERPISYRARPDGSESKVNTFRDGFKILFTIFWILRDYRPMTFFTMVALVFFTGGLALGILIIQEFLVTGTVLRLPSALLSIGLILISVFIAATGFIISTINRRFNELDTLLKKRKR